jgi:hypothetical protein
MMIITNTYLDNLNHEFPDANPIVLLYMWDLIRNVYNEVSYGNCVDASAFDLILAPNVGLEQIWNKFEKDPWGDFDVESFHVVDWMTEEGLLTEWDGE